jgi:hypothetical protein
VSASDEQKTITDILVAIGRVEERLAAYDRRTTRLEDNQRKAAWAIIMSWIGGLAVVGHLVIRSGKGAALADVAVRLARVAAIAGMVFVAQGATSPAIAGELEATRAFCAGSLQPLRDLAARARASAGGELLELSGVAADGVLAAFGVAPVPRLGGAIALLRASSADLFVFELRAANDLVCVRRFSGDPWKLRGAIGDRAGLA